MKILIVENETTTRIFMNRYLSQYGICEVAIDGAEAIDKIAQGFRRNHFYDLICLEMDSPRMEGLELLTLIRDLEDADGHKSIIILMSTRNNRIKMQDACKNGADNYIEKPINTQKFDAMLREMGFAIE